MTRDYDLAELKAQSDGMVEAVALLNMFREFLAAEPNSPQEDQVEAELAAKLNASEGVENSYLIMSLLDMVAKTCDPMIIQDYLFQFGGYISAQKEKLESE